MASVAPVSYTHLSFEGSKLQFSLEPLSQPAALLSGETVLWYNAQSVSYTHLDVYKRQGQHLAGLAVHGGHNDDQTVLGQVLAVAQDHICLLYTSRCV